MLAFPNAKINLGLRILRKRPDGYHDIDSCLYPFPLRDVLEVLPAKEFRFQQTGLDIPGSSDANLCVKAYELVKADKSIDPVHIHLHKVIPMGAGLGGGSADGAFTLKVLNALYQLEYSTEELLRLAAQLGSDCPFFIENKPAIASGTGTALTPIDLSLAKSYLAIKHPDIHVGTKEAYANVVPAVPAQSVKEILLSPADRWKDLLINDFEASVFPNHPEIEQTKNSLYEKGALYAAMTGSGSSVFGIFPEKPSLDGFEIFELN